MNKFDVYYDSNLIETYFGDITPFSLKQDLKMISETQIDHLLSGIASLLKVGLCSSYKEISYKIVNKGKVSFSKMKIQDMDNNKGKSSGFRCIVLVDNINNRCFLLHIFSHKNKDNISQHEHNKLVEILKRYVSSL